MPDRKKVVEALEICANRELGEYTCNKCPYETRVDGDGCEVNLTLDAIALLKEQEAKIEQLNRFVNGFSRDAMPIVRCKYCKHKVDTVDDYNYESKCPCYCSGDEYYSWVPDDDWFCANGERKPD